MVRTFTLSRPEARLPECEGSDTLPHLLWLSNTQAVEREEKICDLAKKAQHDGQVFQASQLGEAAACQACKTQ
jgi:hypothetical protein